jgi:hypothetical protein
MHPSKERLPFLCFLLRLRILLNRRKRPTGKKSPAEGNHPRHFIAGAKPCLG